MNDDLPGGSPAGNEVSQVRRNEVSGEETSFSRADSASADPDILKTPETTQVPKITDAGMLSESISAAALPPGSKVAPRRVNVAREYVAGGNLYWLSSFLRSLPHYVDDLTRDFGDDLYERMLFDPKVASSIETLKLAVLANGLRLLPAVTKGQPGYDKAVEYRDFVQRCLDGMEEPISEVLYDVLDCAAYGNKVAEITYALPEKGKLSGNLTLRTISPRPRRSTSFVVNSYNKCVGLLAVVPDVFMPLMADSILVDANMPNFLPRSKFAIFSWRKRNKDPRGWSTLRSAYTPWWLKQQVLTQYLKHMAQFGSPSIAGIAPEGVVDMPNVDENGNQLTDSAGNVLTSDPIEALLNTLLMFQSGTAGAFAFGTTLVPIDVATGGAQVFEAALAILNGEITEAILLQQLMTNEAKHMARASAEVHQDVFGLLSQYGKQVCQNAIDSDIIRNLIRFNFGEDALELAPKSSLSETEETDFADDAESIGGLWTGGFIAASQVQELDARLGLPQRSEEDLELLRKQKQGLLPVTTTETGTVASAGDGNGAGEGNGAGDGGEAT